MANLELGKSRLKELSDALLRAEPKQFTSLFESRSEPVALPPEIAAPLAGAGLIAQSGQGFIGLHRMRYRNNRFYLMEYQPGEYRQDIWPETDSLLEVLESAKPGRLLDMGTGTGIVAIEAAARGHKVVATDLYDVTLKLAQFNARLNGIEGIEFRQGHLFEPAHGEKFDLILTAPHYTRSADQLRLEALRTGPDCIAEGGRLVVATFFEWEGDGAPIPIVENLLKPLAGRGFDVKVEPIVSPVKRNWFTRAVGEVPKLVSRHRFLVTIGAGGGEVSLARPVEQLDEHFVPLSRLRLDGARVTEPPGRMVVSSDADMARLRDLLVELAGGLVTLSGALPEGMLDSCRWGDGPCVSHEDATGAAGAILDLSGGVRPCTAGGAYARLEDRHSTLLARQRALADQAWERRGCAACEARSWCSRCLYPAPLDERHYCAVMRAAAPELQQLRRLMELMPRLKDARRVQVKMRRTSALVAAGGRPYPPGPPHPRDGFVLDVSLRWHQASGWIVAADDSRYLLSWIDLGHQQLRPVDRLTAGLMELAADGALGDELQRYAISEHIPPDAAWRALDAVAPPAPLL